MSAFAAWGLTILGLAVVTTIAEMLLPQGKTRTVIRSVFATVAVLVIVTPLPKLLKSGFDLDFSGEDIVSDEKYLDYISGVKADIVTDAAYAYLKEKGYDGGFTLSVTMDGWSVKSASIEFSKTGITGNGAHINKSEIIGLIADYFGVGEEAIMTYG